MAKTIWDDVKNKTLGVVGYGDIGKNICKRAHVFGLKTIVWDNIKKNQKILR